MAESVKRPLIRNAYTRDTAHLGAHIMRVRNTQSDKPYIVCNMTKAETRGKCTHELKLYLFMLTPDLCLMPNRTNNPLRNGACPLV